MNGRKIISSTLEIFAILILLGLVIGQFFGQPVLLSFVESGSMEPTLERGDGFIAIPSPLAGNIEQGDVVVFRARQLHGGGLTTHRVVGKTDRGYITHGDANPFRDQAGDEPPVKDEQIVAEALQIGGEVVVIPHVGDFVNRARVLVGYTQQRLTALFGTRMFQGTSGLLYLVTGLIALAYSIDVFQERHGGSSRERTRLRARSQGKDTQLIIVAMILFLIAATTMSMVVPSGTQEFDVEDGESTTGTVTLSNSGVLPAIVVLDPSGGVDVESHALYVNGQSEVESTITLASGSKVDNSRRSLTHHHYLAILPTSIIRFLYYLHPWAPIIVIDAFIGLSFYLLGVALVGTGRIRDRSRNLNLPILSRLRRVFRGLY